MTNTMQATANDIMFILNNQAQHGYKTIRRGMMDRMLKLTRPGATNIDAVLAEMEAAGTINLKKRTGNETTYYTA